MRLHAGVVEEISHGKRNIRMVDDAFIRVDEGLRGFLSLYFNRAPPASMRTV